MRAGLDMRLKCEPASVPLRETRGKTGRASPQRKPYAGFARANSYYLGNGLNLPERWKVTTRHADSLRALPRYELVVGGRENPESAEHYELSYTYNLPPRGAGLTLAGQRQ